MSQNNGGGDAPHHPHHPQSDPGAQNPHNPQNPGASPLGNRKPPPEHTRWKPGQSGNPGGRPKGESLTAKMRRVLEQEHNGRLIADLVAERIVREALAGKFPFAKELLERVEGKVVDKQEIKAKVHWREAIKDMTEDEFVELAVEHNMIDKLPPRLRPLALEFKEKRDGH